MTALALARDEILCACTEVIATHINLARVEEVFELFDTPTRLLVARSLSNELLLTMVFTGNLYEPILTFLLSSIALIPDSPNQGMFGIANDLATEHLLQKLGIDEVAIDDNALVLDPAISVEQFDEWSQATCSLAIDGLSDAYLPLFQKHAADVARGICVAMIERRYLRATRSMRWMALLNLDASLLLFRDEALQRLSVFSHRYREIGFHLEVIKCSLQEGDRP